MSTTATVAPEDALSIFTVQDEKGQVDATVPIRWCISRQTAEMLQKRDIGDPQMVIVVEHDGEEMDHYVVPLGNEMRYIQFRRPGKNVVHATIMWTTGEGSVEEVLDRSEGNLIVKSQPGAQELEKRHNELRERYYEFTENDEEDSDEAVALKAERDGVKAELEAAREKEPVQHKLRDDFVIVGSLGSDTALDVVVPSEMFAKEPPRWMKWLGTFYDGLIEWEPARDQCQLRRRALATAPTVPFVLLLTAVVLLALETFSLLTIGTLLLFGMRNIDYSPLRHPIDNMPKEIWADLEPSVWWGKKTEDKWGSIDYELRHPSLLMVNPPFVVIFSLIGLALYRTIGPVLFLYLGLGAAFAIGLVILIINVAAKGPLARAAANSKTKSEREKKEQEKRDREAFHKELEQLACTSASREVSVSALPKEHQTVALRFQALKVKVCRPFARG